ncbi:unnamed protein product [Ilex paraguariensis]|uniref:MADS-box domain-containing protein n=1 Tax=Ilex paraguariensis TaxID=185542 RepID=A0ABC8R991_9AQUA
MARGKVQMKRIENPVHRQVTFCKRRAGLLKKAKELSVLCDAEIGVLIFSAHGKLHELATNGTMPGLIERYMKSTRGAQAEQSKEEQVLNLTPSIPSNVGTFHRASPIYILDDEPVIQTSQPPMSPQSSPTVAQDLVEQLGSETSSPNVQEVQEKVSHVQKEFLLFIEDFEASLKAFEDKANDDNIAKAKKQLAKQISILKAGLLKQGSDAYLSTVGVPLCLELYSRDPVSVPIHSEKRSEENATSRLPIEDTPIWIPPSSS